MRESIVSTDRKKPVGTATLPVGTSKVKPRIARSRETHASLWPLLAVRHYAKSLQDINERMEERLMIGKMMRARDTHTQWNCG